MSDRVRNILALLFGACWIGCTTTFANVMLEGGMVYLCLMWFGLAFPIVFGVILEVLNITEQKTASKKPPNVDMQFFCVGMSMAILVTVWAFMPALALLMLGAICLGWLFVFYVKPAKLFDFAFSSFGVMLGVTFLIHSL